MAQHQELFNWPFQPPTNPGELADYLHGLIRSLSTMNLRSGAKGFKNGKGYFLGFAKGVSGVTDGTPVLYIGDSTGHYIAWDGSEFTVVGKIGASEYTDGTPVDDLQPAQKAATKGAPTGTNVGSTDAATVESNAVTGYNLTVADSGQQLGDARNGRGLFTAGVGYYISGMALTCPSPTEIDCAAGTLIMGGSGTGNTSYNSGSVTGLTASTPYYCYYLDPGFSGGTLTLNATTDKTVLAQYPDAIYIGTITTPASGSGGTGYTGGGCLHPWQKVATRKGVVESRNLREGDELLTPHGWEPIVKSWAEPCSEWIEVCLSDGDVHHVSRTQPYMTKRGWVRAHDLTLGDQCEDGPAITGLKAFRDPTEKVCVNIAAPHTFFLGRAKIHNAGGKP